MSVFGVILVRIFPHLDWIWRDTEISPYSVRMRENADQNNSEYGHFSRSEDVNAEKVILTSCLSFHFCINYIPINPVTKAIGVNACSATNPTALPRKLKIVLTVFPTIAGNASTAFSGNILIASASFLNHFYNTPSSLGGKAARPLLPPKTPRKIASAIVETVMERAVSIDIIVIPSSRN